MYRKFQSLFLLSMSLLLLVSTPTLAGEVHVYTDREIRSVLLALINHADHSVDVEMYSLTDAQVVAALEHAEARGVHVQMILDPHQAGNRTHLERLKQHGVEVKWCPINPPAQMHRKLAIVDDTKVLLGSANWTANGLDRNEEIVVVLDDATTVHRLHDIFSDDWYHAWLGDHPRE